MSIKVYKENAKRASAVMTKIAKCEGFYIADSGYPINIVPSGTQMFAGI
jgi:hypothetical protein